MYDVLFSLVSLTYKKDGDMKTIFADTLPTIIRNDRRLYEGDLTGYFRAVFKNARNLYHPYHNFRHMFHVVWLCYQACAFYAGELNPREMRNLLIAAVFHDFDHAETMGNDAANIAKAIKGLKKYILPGDRSFFKEIAFLIKATEYPPKAASHNPSLCGQILMDADMAQALSDVWIQQIVFGLGKEYGKRPMEMLENEVAFHKNLKFHTAWARKTFSRREINKKTTEVLELLELLR